MPMASISEAARNPSSKVSKPKLAKRALSGRR